MPDLAKSVLVLLGVWMLGVTAVAAGVVLGVWALLQIFAGLIEGAS